MFMCDGSVVLIGLDEEVKLVEVDGLLMFSSSAKRRVEGFETERQSSAGFQIR